MDSPPPHLMTLGFLLLQDDFAHFSKGRYVIQPNQATFPYPLWVLARPPVLRFAHSDFVSTCKHTLLTELIHTFLYLLMELIPPSFFPPLLPSSLPSSSFPSHPSSLPSFTHAHTLHGVHRSSEAKLNNFMRLEPTFRLLDIPFNINMVGVWQALLLQWLA